MSPLADRGQALSVALREHGALTQPRSAELHPDGAIGIRIHFDDVADVVGWAHVHGTVLSFADKRMYIRVSTTFLSGGEAVMADAQLSPVDAYRLLQTWGYALEGAEVQVAAAHAFAMLKSAVV